MTDTVSDKMLDAGRGYEGLFVPALFAVWTPHLIAGAGIGDGAHVLDVACGTGVLARAALARTGPAGRVVGVDPAPGMIGAAREVENGIEWILGSAEDLAFGDAAFDSVVSQFGMMFFQDKAAAAGEMYRVMKPGGGLAVAVWNSVDANPAYGDVSDLVEQEVGKTAGDAVRLPFSLGDPRVVTALMEEAGFEGIAVETRTERARFPSVRHMVEAELRGWLPLFDIHLDEQTIGGILTKADQRLAKFSGPGGPAEFPTSAHVLRARKASAISR